MTGKNISDQLSYLPDDMIEEAMEMPKRQRTLRFTARVLRAAACFAVIAGLLFGIWGRGGDPTAPQGGLLTITVYGIDQDKDTNKVEELVLLPYANILWPQAVNSFYGFPMGLAVADDKYDFKSISFRASADGGWLYVGKLGEIYMHQMKVSPLDTSTVIPNNTAIFWLAKNTASHERFTGDTAFIDVVIYEGTQIIGYTVIRLDQKYDEYGATRSYYVSMPANEIFSTEETITEEYVRQQIDEVKKAK